MPVVITCPACRRKARVPDTALGKTVKCPGCGATFPATLDDSTPLPAPPLVEEDEVPEPSPEPPAPDTRRVERTGIGLLGISQGVFAVSLALQLLVALLGMISPNTEPKSAVSVSISQVAILIAVLAGLTGAVAALIGAIFCIVPPASLWARATAASVLILTLLALVRPPAGSFRDLVSGQAVLSILTPAMYESARQATLAIYAFVQARRLGDASTAAQARFVAVAYPAAVMGLVTLVVLVGMFSSTPHPTFDRVVKIVDLLAQTVLVAWSAFVLWRVWTGLRLR